MKRFSNLQKKILLVFGSIFLAVIFWSVIRYPLLGFDRVVFLIYIVYSIGFLLRIKRSFKFSTTDLIPIFAWGVLVLLSFWINKKLIILILIPCTLASVIAYLSAYIVLKFNNSYGWFLVTAFFTFMLIYAFYLIPKREFEGNELNSEKSLDISDLSEIQLKDLKGKSISFKDIGSKKIIYIEFWFTSCPPCLEKMDIISKLSVKYKNEKDLTFVSIVDGANTTFEEFQKSAKQFQPSFNYYLYSPKQEILKFQKILNFNSYPFEVTFINDNLKGAHSGFSLAEENYYYHEKTKLFNSLLNL